MNLYKQSVLATLVCVGLSAALAASAATSTYNDGNENVVEQTLPDRTSSTGDTRVTAGLGLANTALYVGSNERRYRVMPMLNATWGNGWFAGFPRGVGYNFSADPRMQYGLRLTADMGRKQSASAALNGLGDIGARPELGGFLNYALSRQLKLDTGVRYGAGRDSQGMLLDLGLHYRVPLTDKQFLTFGIATTYANSSYMQSFYGVDAAQAATSKYAVYTPGAGIREVDLTASYIYKLDRQWAVVTGATLGQLGSAVKAAPMTRSNSHNSVYVLTNYTF